MIIEQRASYPYTNNLVIISYDDFMTLEENENVL